MPAQIPPHVGAVLSLVPDLNGLILGSIAMIITAWILPKLRITGVTGVVGMVLALSIVNGTIWDAALFFEIPNNFGERSLILLVANGLLFWGLVKLLPGIEVDGFLTALIAPLLFTVINTIAYQYGKDIDWIKVGEQILEGISQLRTQLKGGR